MNRRDLLISAGVVAAFSAIPFIRRLNPPAPLTIQNAYSLWYNRPAVAELTGGFCFGYITSGGEVSVAEITNDLLVRRVNVMARFEGASDHGSPALIRIPCGKFEGHILACFSNHASPLYCMRTKRPEDIGEWEDIRVLDTGRSTYASVAGLPNGRIVLMHTLQERIGNSSAGEWRRTVARSSDDGGETWSTPVQIAGFGAGTFPYSTPLALSSEGRCAMSYAIYRSEHKRHEGLSVVISEDAFLSKIEIPISLGDDQIYDTIPYETRWVENDTVVVSYSQMSQDGTHGVGKIAFVDVENRSVKSIVTLSEAAVHTYAGGAALDGSGSFAISSPPGGGLIMQDIRNGNSQTIIERGSFSSPWIFTLQGKPMISALKNPSIETTRRFSSELFVMPLA